MINYQKRLLEKIEEKILQSTQAFEKLTKISKQ